VSADIWSDFGDTLGDRIADDLRSMVREQEKDSERTQQSDLGPSEIGDPCTYCLAAKILNVYEHESSGFDDGWRAVVGTSVHDWLDGAAAAWNVRHDTARFIPELRVQPDQRLLPSGGRCDLFDNETRTVVDHKTTTKAKLATYRLNGPSVVHRRQAHLYGLGYANAGHNVRHVALAFWLRDGMLRDLYVWTEPYSEQIAKDALSRYDTIRGLCETAGAAVLESLPSDPGCDTCSRRQSAAQAS
jgi:hypothetical protein